MKFRQTTTRASASIACLGLLLVFAQICHAASAWDAPAAELARQIASLTGPGAVSLSLHNLSSLSPEELPAIRRSLMTSLNALGVTVQPGPDAATSVRVTLSQNARQGVWVAEVQQGPDVRVAMVNVANTAPAAKPQGTPVLLRTTLLWSQAQPILDAQFVTLPGDTPASQHLVVLSPESIAIYRSGGSAWIKAQSLPIAHSRPYPRDVRGRLQIDAGGTFKAYLAGVICTSSQVADPSASITLACADSDDPWPLGSRSAFFNASRNYFTGVLIPSSGADAEPFYSAADLIGKRGAATVFSEVGGQFLLVDPSGVKPLAGSRDWGSDVAGVPSGCGAGAQLIASMAGDGAADSLLAYEVDGREAIPASPPLAVDGQVAALWPAEGSAATVILRKEQPLHYEAYRVSVVCTQ